MAAIRQINGRWQVQIRRVDVRRSRTFNSRAEAEAWAHSVEAPLRLAASRSASAVLGDGTTTFGAVVRPYQEQELPKPQGLLEVIVRVSLRLVSTPAASAAP